MRVTVPALVVPSGYSKTSFASSSGTRFLLTKETWSGRFSPPSTKDADVISRRTFCAEILLLPDKKLITKTMMAMSRNASDPKNIFLKTECAGREGREDVCEKDAW